MVAGWKPPRRGRDASFLSINRSRKAITQHGKREKWTWDGNLLEGAEMLAVHPSIKPKIAWSHIIQQRESLVFYKSLSILWNQASQNNSLEISI